MFGTALQLTRAAPYCLTVLPQGDAGFATNAWKRGRTLVSTYAAHVMIVGAISPDDSISTTRQVPVLCRTECMLWVLSLGGWAD